MARQYINTKASFPWDEYVGSIITVSDKISYTLTPVVSNYFATSRDTSVATTNNVTVTPKNAASFDDTYNLAKCTATGASPYVQRQSLTTVNNGRVSASIWLKGDTTNTPGTITLTLTDSAGAQSVTKTITNDGTLQRYGITGYFTSAQTAVRLRVSWTSTTGIVYLDGWQVELNDWPSEYIDNSTGAAVERTAYVDPLRLHSLAPYKYNTRLTWNEVVYPDGNLYPYDHTDRGSTLYTFYSVKGNLLNVDSVVADTHLVYRGKKVPPIYTTGTQTVDVPAPYLWTMIRGIVAYQKAAMYDIGSNKEAMSAMSAFESQVEDMILTSAETPGWSYVDVLNPVMMR